MAPPAVVSVCQGAHVVGSWRMPIVRRFGARAAADGTAGWPLLWLDEDGGAAHAALRSKAPATASQNARGREWGRRWWRRSWVSVNGWTPFPAPALRPPGLCTCRPLRPNDYDLSQRCAFHGE